MTPYREETLIEAKQVITHIAVGLLRQDDAIRAGISQPVTSLDEMLQWGWDKLALFCYTYGASPPRHLSEFVHLMHEPLDTWEGLGSLFAAADLSGPLLTFGAPSEFCIELGRDMHLSDDPERELQDTPFKEILAYCKKQHLPEQYTAARKFLVDHPYLPYGSITISQDPQWEPVIRNWLKLCYEPIPLICQRPGQPPAIARCPRCGWPLEWRTPRQALALCYSDLCVRLVKHIHDPEEWYPLVPEAMRTTRGIQQSIVGPEVPLVKLYQILVDDYGLHCELWPEVDTFDLLVHFSDGTIWAVDMKDHLSPTRLASQVSGFRSIPRWDDAFFVFPEHRRRAGYMRTFQALWKKPKEQQIEALFVNDFLARVRAYEQTHEGRS